MRSTPSPAESPQVRGDSMVEAGINDGDFAIIDTANDAESGTIAAVMVDEEATLKVIRSNAAR